MDLLVFISTRLLATDGLFHSPEMVSTAQNGLDIKAIFDKVTDNIPFLYDLFFVPEGNDMYDANYYQKEHKFVSVTKHPLAEGNVTDRFTVGKHEYFPFPEDALNLNPELKQHANW